MPAITVDDTLVLPRIPRPDSVSRPRPVADVVTAHSQMEGGGIAVRRPFPGELTMAQADPFLLLDHAGPHVAGPGEAKGAPWHPHRGFETYEHPEAFDIFRDPKQHLSFGTGPHVCLGMHLARMETRVALNALFDRLPNLRLDEDEAQRIDPHIRGDMLFRSPTTLPVMWDHV